MDGRSVHLARCSIGLSLLWWSATAIAAVPYGTSPYLYGVHDQPSRDFFASSGPCDRGWITELYYIEESGSCGHLEDRLDFRRWADRGVGVIMRLDYLHGPSVPPRADQYGGFARSFADCVRRAKGIKVWVVGNEPNLGWGHPEGRPFRPEEYGEVYRRVVEEVDKLEDGAEHQVLFAGMGPWAAIAPWGDWEDGLRDSMRYVLDRGGRIDGAAVHAYTRNDFSTGAIRSDAWFPGRANKWHNHFRVYRDHLAVMAELGVRDVPLYITESGNVCDPLPCDPYPSEDRGYFQAMYREVDAWNQGHPRQKIRAVTPYRWTENDDGSGRDFCIGCSDGLKQDLRRAMAEGARWTDESCHPASEPAPDAGVIDDGGRAPETPVPDAGTEPEPETETVDAGAVDAGVIRADDAPLDETPGAPAPRGRIQGVEGKMGCRHPRSTAEPNSGLVGAAGLLALLGLGARRGRRNRRRRNERA